MKGSKSHQGSRRKRGKVEREGERKIAREGHGRGDAPAQQEHFSFETTRPF
jgi:hypothetical protein